MTFQHRKDLMNHKVLISQQIKVFIEELYNRQMYHDNDKISDDLIFHDYDKYNHHLRSEPFGADKYKSLMQNELRNAAQKHAQNRHHFYAKSNEQEYNITMFDYLEVIADMRASILRNQSLSTIEVNELVKIAITKMYGDLTIKQLCENTIDELFKEDNNA